MRKPTISETLFEQLCSGRGVRCEPIPEGFARTPDFAVQLGGTCVFCEVKQIEPNREDLEDMKTVGSGEGIGRFVPNRLRTRLKKVSGQLKAAALSGSPTMLVMYDNTPFKMYSLHADIVEAMFGHRSVAVRVSAKRGAAPTVSKPFFGENRGFTPSQNTSVSALAVLDGGPTSRTSLRVYHNPYASVVLCPELLEVLEAVQPLLPGATTVTL